MDSGLCQPELRYLYPIYFDSARVLLAECVAEFFQTGMICGRFKPQGSRQALPELLPLQMQPLQV